MTKAKSIILIILILLVILFVYNASLLFSHRMNYIEYNKAGILINKVEPVKSKQEYKKDIDKMLDVSHIYLSNNLITMSFVPTRTVFVDENANIKEYIKSYTHELVHIKYNTRNERFTTYTTITTLYETEDKYLQYLALDYANDVWGGQFVKTKYDCGYQLAEYFKDKI